MPVPELATVSSAPTTRFPVRAVSWSASTDRRAPTGDLPCVYWMHGGGLVIGSYTGDDARFDRWCPLFDCVGVSVEYRLAPESPYPGPLDDSYAGLAWVHANAADSASTRRASASAARAPAPAWPPGSRCWPATGVRCR